MLIQKQKKGKVESLIRKFPFLVDIIKHWDQNKSVVDIKIKKIDVDFLLYVGQYHDTNRGMFEHTNSMWQGIKKEQVFIISSNNEIISSRDFQLRNKVYDFIKYQLGNISAIVTYTSFDWYNKYREVDNLGDMLSKESKVNIYLLPNEGLESMYNSIDLHTNVVLDDKMLISATIRQDTFFKSIHEDLIVLTKKFQSFIYVFLS